MTSTVEATTDNPQRNPLWPSWAPPAGSAGAWLLLQLAIREHDRRLACERDPEAWFATRATPVLAARQAAAVEACSWCPVLEECRAYALVAGERDGVWGGLTPAELRAER